MRVARMEPESDAASRRVERYVLTRVRPLASECPLVEPQVPPTPVRRRDVLTASGAEIGLGRVQVIPVGRGLYAKPFDRDELAIEAEQPLDQPLRLLVASFAEVLILDDALGVDEVQRRPVVVREGAPDFVVIVDRDWVVDRSLVCRAPHAVDVVLEGELWRVDADDDQPVVAIGL